MKIKEKAKSFVKNHKGEIIAGAIGGSLALAGYAGFVLGRKFTFGEVESLTTIDLTRDFAYNVRDFALKEVVKEESLPEALKQCGFASLDDIGRTAVLVQKK